MVFSLVHLLIFFWYIACCTFIDYLKKLRMLIIAFYNLQLSSLLSDCWPTSHTSDAEGCSFHHSTVPMSLLTLILCSCLCTTYQPISLSCPLWKFLPTSPPTPHFSLNSTPIFHNSIRSILFLNLYVQTTLPSICHERGSSILPSLPIYPGSSHTTIPSTLPVHSFLHYLLFHSFLES